MVLVLVPAQVWAALTCSDANAVQTNNATPSNPTVVAYTKPSGSNQVQHIFVGQRTGTTPRTFTITNAAGDTITEVTSATYTDPIEGRLFRIINPTAGSNAVTINWSPSAPLAESIRIVTCTDADTSGYRSFSSSTGTGITPSTTPSIVQSGDLVVDFLVSESTADPAAGSDQTPVNHGTAGTEISGGSSYQAGADGAAMTWTTNSNDWSLHAVVIKPLVATSKPPGLQRRLAR